MIYLTKYDQNKKEQSTSGKFYEVLVLVCLGVLAKANSIIPMKPTAMNPGAIDKPSSKFSCHGF